MSHLRERWYKQSKSEYGRLVLNKPPSAQKIGLQRRRSRRKRNCLCWCIWKHMSHLRRADEVNKTQKPGLQRTLTCWEEAEERTCEPSLIKIQDFWQVNWEGLRGAWGEPEGSLRGAWEEPESDERDECDERGRRVRRERRVRWARRDQRGVENDERWERRALERWSAGALRTTRRLQEQKRTKLITLQSSTTFLNHIVI